MWPLLGYGLLYSFDLVSGSTITAWDKAGDGIVV